MTTAEIQTAANRGNIATADFVIGQVLRRQVIPQFLEDVGVTSWRKVYTPITTVLGTQVYNLSSRCLKVHEVYRTPIDTYPGPMKYIGEDPLAVARAETNTTRSAPCGYYVVTNPSSTGNVLVEGTFSLSFGAIADGAIATQTVTLAGAIIGNQVIVVWPTTLESGLVGEARVSGTNTIEVRLCNLSGDTLTPATQTFTFAVLDTLTSSTIALSTNANLTFGAIADGAIAVQTVPLPGVTTGSLLTVGWPSALEAGLLGMARVSAADTIEVRLANLSGDPITPAVQTFTFAALDTVSASAGPDTWQAIKLQAPADAVYSLMAIELGFIPFTSDTASVDLKPYIPEQFHWALVDGLRAQIFFDRFGQGDPRYDRAQKAYDSWIEKAITHRELGRRNYFVSVR